MKKFFFCFFALSFITFNLEPESSLTNLASWFSSNTEKTYNKTLDIATDNSLTINNTQGSITVHTWSKPKIALDVVISAKEKKLENVHVQIEENKKTKMLTISTVQSENKIKTTAQYKIMVPDYIPLYITTENGDIKIKGSKALLNIKTEKGKIIIQGAKHSVYAYTGNGSINITYKRLTPESTIQIESEHGNITLGLPAFSQANIAARTLNGTVTTEQEVMLKPQQVQLGPDAWELQKKQAFCTIGNGGTAISIFTKNGNIKITEL